MNETHRTMRSILQRIATGPELSKDISMNEARLGMNAILDSAVDGSTKEGPPRDRARV